MGKLKTGQLQIKAGYGNVLIDFREHDTRNGKLLVPVDGNPLDARELRDLASLLEKEEEKLQTGRARFQGAGQHFVTEFLDEYDAETIKALGELLAFQLKKAGKGKTDRIELYEYKDLFFCIEGNYAEEYSDSMDAILESRIAMKTKDTVSVWLSDCFDYLK